VPEIMLQSPRVLAVVGQLVAARVPQHVRVSRQREFGQAAIIRLFPNMIKYIFVFKVGMKNGPRSAQKSNLRRAQFERLSDVRILEPFSGCRSIPRLGDSQRSISSQRLCDPAARGTSGVRSPPRSVSEAVNELCLPHLRLGR